MEISLTPNKEVYARRVDALAKHYRLMAESAREMGFESETFTVVAEFLEAIHFDDFDKIPLRTS